MPSLPGPDLGQAADLGPPGPPDLGPRTPWRALSPTPPESDLTAIAGTDATDFYVATQDAIVHWSNGTPAIAWQAPQSACLRGLSVQQGVVAAAGGCGTDGLVVVGVGGTYQQVPLGNVQVGAVWVDSATSIYVASPNIGIFRLVGAALQPEAPQWTVPALEPGTGPVAFYGTAASSLYAVGNSRILQMNSGMWETQAQLTQGTQLLSVSGVQSDVYVVGTAPGATPGTMQAVVWHRTVNGMGQPMPFAAETVVGGATQLAAVWADSLTDVYALSDEGGVLKRSTAGAVSWSEERPRAVTNSDLRGLWGVEPQVLAAGAGGLLNRSAGPPVAWQSVGSAQITGARLYGAAVAPSGAAWVAGAGGTIFANPGLGQSGSLWTQQAQGLTSQDLLAVLGLSGGNAYAVGRMGVVLQCNAGTWAKPRAEGMQPDLYAVTAAGGAAYAVGAAGTMIQQGNGAWTLTAVQLSDGTPVTSDLLAVQLLPDQSLLLAGAAGQILYRAPGGTRFTAIAPATSSAGGPPAFVGIALLPGGPVWVVAQSGLVVKLGVNGQGVTGIDQAPMYQVTGIYGTGPADVYLSGADRRVVHYDGYGWADEPIPVGEPLLAVAGAGGSSGAPILAVGAEGYVIAR